MYGVLLVNKLAKGWFPAGFTCTAISRTAVPIVSLLFKYQTTFTKVAKFFLLESNVKEEKAFIIFF